MIGSILYNIFIMPIELVFQVVFWFLQETPGTAIIAVSLVMNFLALPLYKRADAIHEEEKQKTKAMAAWVSRIRSTFQGDERYMMLQTYYRQQHYKPIYGLRSSVSLLLQVPFFIAAYHFLSNSTLLAGRSFLFLQDLGQPDQMIRLGSLTVNLMPVVMTLINVLSACIYLRGSSLRDKLQTYGIAAVFLVLLYNSPSGLVFYWTLNQIFSVFKNIFMKVIRSERVRQICFSGMGILAFVMFLWIGFLTSFWRILFSILILAAFQLPLFTGVLKTRNKRKDAAGSHGNVERKTDFSTPGWKNFFPGALLMSVLTGLVIPLSVISSSPNEFVTEATDPVMLTVQNFCICLGLFAVWLGVYYLMSGAFVRRLFVYGMFLMCGISLLDFMVFSYDLGPMSSYLVFSSLPGFSLKQKILNLAAVVLMAVVLAFLMKYLHRAVPYIFGILIAGCLILSGWYGISSVQEVRATATNLIREDMDSEPVSGDAGIAADGIDGKTEKQSIAEQENAALKTEQTGILSLDKTGRNVVILMLDRAVSGYVPYMFREKPELSEQFAGFTYYPNTVSLGCHTNYSAPSLYGGYEYTPANMNLRTDEDIPEKHNQAIRLLPRLFSEAGYQVTVCDPLYAGYQKFIPDLSVYEDLEHVNAMITYGLYGDELLTGFESAIQLTQKRNFFFYSLFRVAPVVLRNAVYNNGNYYYTSTSGGLSCSDEFLYAYSVLKKLPELTEVTDDGQGRLLILNNNTTHAPSILQTPEYEPVVEVTSDPFADQERFTLDGETVKMENLYQIAHYHANMAAFLKIGIWLDYLRENDLYDNTRIIILSDHGNGLGQFEDLLVAPDWDAQWVNSLLMVKDFDSTEFTVSDEFMTAADMPAIAVREVIRDPVNPSTGYDITTPVNKEEQMITSAHVWDIDRNRGTTFDVSGGSWWKVHGNVHDAASWERVGE